MRTDDDPLVELLDIVKPSWMRDALCREFPDVSWFPEGGESAVEAKRICGRCLVRDTCLEYGLAFEHGLWGGMGVRERRRLRIQRRELVVGTDRGEAA